MKKTAKSAKKSAKKSAPKSPKPREITGFVALIDALLHQGVTAKPDHGFARSRHSVESAVAAIMAKFPKKDKASVKRIVKVRPRHLERQKAGAYAYDGKKNRAPRWAWVGPGHAEASRVVRDGQVVTVVSR
jgi:hypothetical protein